MQRAILTALLAAAVTGCNGGSGSGSVERWAIEPDLRIGEIDGPDALGTVTALEVDGDGAIHVVEWSAGTVRVFDREGRAVRRIGRSGNGPGEFTYNPGRVIVAGDTLLATDPIAGRYHVFLRDGTLLETVALRGALTSGPGRVFAPAVPLPGGAVVGTHPFSISRDYGAAAPPPQPVLRFDTMSGTVDTLALIQTTNRALLVMLATGGFATTQPLQDASLWDIAHDRESILVVDRNAATDATSAA